MLQNRDQTLFGHALGQETPVSGQVSIRCNINKHVKQKHETEFRFQSRSQTEFVNEW